MIGLFLAFSICQLLGLFLILASFGIDLEIIGRLELWLLFMNYYLYDRLDREMEEKK